MLSESKVSGKPALKPALHNKHKITIPHDDHRNNPHFLSMHPEVVVAGKKGSSHKNPHEHHPAQKHDHRTQTKKGKKNVPRPHIPRPGTIPKEPMSSQDQHDEWEREEDENDQSSNQEDDDFDFCFHEYESEHYDLDTHAENSATSRSEPTPSSEGTIRYPAEIDVLPPTNLSVSNLAVNFESPQDGIPTYKATLYMDSGASDEEIEYRIVKI